MYPMVAQKVVEPIPHPTNDGRYRIRVDLPHMRGAPRRRKPIYGRSAEECLVNFRAWAKSGGRAPDEDPRVSDILSAWLTWLDPPDDEARVDISTWIGYETHVRRHIGPFLGGVRASALRVRDVEDWLIELRAGGQYPDGKPRKPMTPPMRRKVLTTLRMALKWAEGRELIDRNPASAAGLPRKAAAKKWVPVPDDELDGILAAIKDHRLRALMMMAVMRGPRMGELNALWGDNLDREARTIEIDHNLSWAGGRMRRKETKTPAGQRTIRLPDALWDVLMEHEKLQQSERAKAGSRWLGDDSAPYIFTRGNGHPLRGDGSGGVGDQWKGCLRRGGMPIRNFHQTRHIAASLLLRLNGNNLVEVGQLIGHSTHRHTVDMYAHLAPAATAALAASLDAFYAARAAAGGSTGGSK